MPLQTATPKDEGRWAYRDGSLRCLCPYPPNTGAAGEWLRGWDAAERKAQAWPGVWA